MSIGSERKFAAGKVEAASLIDLFRSCLLSTVHLLDCSRRRSRPKVVMLLHGMIIFAFRFGIFGPNRMSSTHSAATEKSFADCIRNAR